MLLDNLEDGHPTPADALFTSMNDTFLLELLFLRDTLDLDAGHDLPHLTPAPPKRPSRRVTELGNQWDGQWATASEWMLGTPERHELTHQAAETPTPELFAQVLPPRWSAVNEEAFDRNAFYAWQDTVPTLEDFGANTQPTVDARPGLQEARGRGLRVLIVLPFDDAFAKEIGDRGLMVSWSTFTNPGALKQAVTNFQR